MTERRWGRLGLAEPRDALKSWRATVREIEAEVRGELGLGRSEVLRPRDVVNEVIRLADPNAVPGRDVVIPGRREDLVRIWIAARLKGEVPTADDRLALARKIAAGPEDGRELRFRRRGQQRYAQVLKFQAKVSEEAAKRFKDSPPFPN